LTRDQWRKSFIEWRVTPQYGFTQDARLSSGFFIGVQGLNNAQDRTERLLLVFASIFLGLYAIILTLSPAVRARTWAADYRWGHWLGYGIWLVAFTVAHRKITAKLPSRDPTLLPIVAMLSGWGLLTIWRLNTTFGLRQSIWLGITLSLLILGFRLPPDLNFLRRYKYLWLTGGLLLTALTLLLGTNPMGAGPRLWLGCCGIYFQPSEPLKLLLIVYLSAYLADWQALITPPQNHLTSLRRPNSKLNILLPTFIMTGTALLLLLVQRDLGTATIFIFLYAVMVYLASGWPWIPLVSGVVLGLAGVTGYLLFDVVRLRVDAWINPWLDPSGRSYQIVQSLIAVANGGVFGRGPGMGNPTLVPVAHSDFVFAAIAEEAGLVGSLALLILIALLAHRGLRTALYAPDAFRRYLATGLTAYLVAQSILIIGGNLRLLPLTGVTLPFVSYGGSSLLTSYIALFILLKISSSPRQPVPQPLRQSAPQIHLANLLFVGLGGAALVNGWWAFYRGPDLLTRTDNTRRSIADRFVRRGSLLDRNNTPIVETIGNPGDYLRQVQYPDLGPVAGYTHPIYGQSGLEASLDGYLRGLRGIPAATIWWNHILYGQPPPGLDVRLTLDLDLQRFSDAQLTGYTGALVLLNAQNGEILVMASHPTFDPNQLDQEWNRLIEDPLSPLLNRATQGSYPVGELGQWVFLGNTPTGVEGLPRLRLPTSDTPDPRKVAHPLQVALAVAALSNQGTRPAPRLVQAVNIPAEGWVPLPPLDQPVQILTPEEVTSTLASLASPAPQTWSVTANPPHPNSPAGGLTWYLSGTLPTWEGTPMTLVLLLEEDNPALASEIGAAVLDSAMWP
jgi:cell division protein FtsW (lipid II flippase)